MSVDPELSATAPCTHRSYAYERGGLPTNERLEFLGDAVLGLVVTEHLFVSYPDLSEGQLAKLRAAVVNSRALADIARDLDLGAVIHLGRGEESTGGRDKSSILADTMEAVIGAVFLQHGVEAARAFVHHLFDGLMADVATRGAGLDWKTSLQEIASVAGLGVPGYEVVESGPDHAKSFSAHGQDRQPALRPRRRPQQEGGRAERCGHRLRGPQGSTRHRPRRRSLTQGTVPELPEVEVVRRGLAAGITGRQITAVEVLHARPVRRHLLGPTTSPPSWPVGPSPNPAVAVSTSGCR